MQVEANSITKVIGRKEGYGGTINKEEKKSRTRSRPLNLSKQFPIHEGK